MTALAVAAERGAMTALEGSCRTAVGAHAEIAEGRLRLTTERLAPDGSARWRRSGEIGDVAAADAMDQARALGLQLGAGVHAMAGDQRVQP
jgi:hydroxymethylbilane synthase